jgi:carboxypeptidase C (cathepsin A)
MKEKGLAEQGQEPVRKEENEDRHSAQYTGKTRGRMYSRVRGFSRFFSASHMVPVRHFSGSAIDN